MRGRSFARILVPVLLVGGALAGTPRAGAGAPADAPALPAVASPTASAARWSGIAALARLGDRLPDVARAHGWTVAELRARFANDPTLFLDGNDELVFVDEARPVKPGPQPTPPTPLDSTIADADTFLLHSRPGASRTLYLDFDGQVLTGTAWNASTGGDCVAEPFDADGAASSFSTSELAIVKSVWTRVAEDYAPFDVDVTTQDPGTAALDRTASTDLGFGARALITNSKGLCPNGKTLYASVCPNGCGGIAYVGVYDEVGTAHDYYQPALVFENGVGTNPKYVAEAAAHELGHNGGLSHDGATSGCGDGTAGCAYYEGQGSWAPIMGAGYYKAVTQWSRGEYALASNTEDDLAVLQANGLPLRTDDAGDTAATATVLAVPSAKVTGVLSSAVDVDAYAVTVGAGVATFAVSTVPYGPDADLRLEVRDATGALVAATDPPSGSTTNDAPTGLAATVTLTLPAGAYTVLVDGVGAGDPRTVGYSDYASTGYYTLTSTVVAPALRVDVAGVLVTGTKGRSSVSASAAVTVVDAASSPVAAATVSGVWTLDGKVLGSKSATTGVNGVATVASGNVKASSGQSLSFCVTGVAVAGGTWDPSILAPATATDCATWTVG